MTNTNMLYYGDNLDVLRRYIPDESIDLIYLDPPFKSDQDYNVLFKEQNGSRAAAQIKAFKDTWKWDQASAKAYQDVILAGGRTAEVMLAFDTFLGKNDMLAYLAMMTPRLVELRRVLKLNGSIYLHCDPTASHYLKLLMDAVFGPKFFKNEIIWKRTSSHGGAIRYGPIHDTILFYSRSDDYLWNEQHTPYSDEYVEKFFRYKDPDGREYRSADLTGAGTSHGSSGKPWRGTDPTSKGRHWAVPGYVRPLLGKLPSSDVQTALDKLDSIGRVLWPKKKDGVPRFKQYKDDLKGVKLQDIWTDIPPIHSHSKERLSYPTQKPEALLERIILSSSNEGAVILDPFCGCGTTISVAQRLNRSWIGIDITHLAIALMKHRLKSAFGDSVKYKVIGEPVSLPDARILAKQDPYQFQWWALGLVGARPVEQKKGADKGIDGRLYFFPNTQMKGKPKQIIFSVKAGNVTVSHIRDLVGVINREKAAIGVYISINKPTRPMRGESASAGFYESGEVVQNLYPRIQLLTIEELLDGKHVEYPSYAQWRGNVTLKKAPKTEKIKPESKSQKLEKYSKTTCALRAGSCK